MSNTKEIKKFRYYEGLCSSDNFPKELAKVLAIGVVDKEEGNNEDTVCTTNNWNIVYPVPDNSYLNGDEPDEFNPDHYSPQAYKSKILNQVNKIKDHVILETWTTEKEEGDKQSADLSVDEDAMETRKHMYLEIYKPKYIADPEQYPLDCELKGISEPKLITKELHEKRYLDHLGYEEELNDLFDTSRISGDPVTKSISSTNVTGTVARKLGYDQANDYLTQINNANNGTEYLPSPRNTGETTVVTLGKALLTKIKQEDAFNTIYSFITDRFAGLANYDMFETLTIQFMVAQAGDFTTSQYQIDMSAEVKKIIYSIKSGTMFTLEHIPLDAITPELYKDGMYIPIEKKYYEATKTAGTAKIRFINNYEYESTLDGILVVRYEYAVDASGNLITERETVANNHYLLMRLFDNIDNNTYDRPSENVYDSAGHLILVNSHPSPWVKLSWYQDFEEVMIDTIDADVPINTIADGSVFVPLVTPGLNGDTKLQYWINTNNDRFSLIVMGNASLDYSRDRHLISSCYCGAIDSFENSILDVSGNFALYASSSTEPCKTVLDTERTYIKPYDYILTQADIDNGTVDANNEEFNAFLSNVPYISESTGEQTYSIQIKEDNAYFKEDDPIKYLFIDENGNPKTPLLTANGLSFTDTTHNGKNDTAEIMLNPEAYEFPSTYKIVVSFGYYKEKIILKSGVTRDMFGNVINVAKEDMYGKETSDGITSVMMFHSRSKNYYQKHRLLFATTEEYMSKKMYGKSRYTGEYYADRIKITHSNDGPRGILSDLLVIDNSALFPLDELVINKDYNKSLDEPEETFIYFPITAPYSPLSDGPNARYGLAIKKSEEPPKFDDEEALVNAVIKILDRKHKNAWDPTQSDIYPPQVVDEVKDKDNRTAGVYWKVINNPNERVDKPDMPKVPYELDDNGERQNLEHEPIRIVVTNISNLKGDMNSANAVHVTPIVMSEDTPESGTIAVASHEYTIENNTAHIAIRGLDTIPEPAAGEEQTVFYGYGIAEETDEILSITSEFGKLGENAQLKYVVWDNDQYKDSERFEYGIEGMPFTENIVLDGDILALNDAEPDKYLVIYKYEHEYDSDTHNESYNILQYGLIKMTRELLQYPCSVIGLVNNGKGEIAIHPASGAPKYSDSFMQTCLYNEEIVIHYRAGDGWRFKKATIGDEDIPSASIDTTNSTITISPTNDITINIEFEQVS